MMLRIRLSPMAERESGRKITPGEIFEKLLEAFSDHRDFHLKNAPKARAAIRRDKNGSPCTRLLAASGDTMLILQIFYQESAGRYEAEDICAGLAVS